MVKNLMTFSYLAVSTKKPAIKFLCCSVVSIIVCQFNGCCVLYYACA